MDRIPALNTRKPTIKQIVKRKKLKVSVPVGNGFRYAMIDSKQLSEICSISESHAYRWISGTTIIPKGYMDLIKIKSIGLLPDRDWWEWSAIDGHIVSPSGFKFSPEELNQIHYIRSLNREYEKQVKTLKSQLEQNQKDFSEYITKQSQLKNLENSDHIKNQNLFYERYIRTLETNLKKLQSSPTDKQTAKPTTTSLYQLD